MSQIKKILLISDVHGDIYTLNKILEIEKDVDLKIFAGDLQKRKYEVIEKNFDYFVLGNSDFLIKNVPNEIVFEFEEISFYLTHGHLFGSIFQKIDFNSLIQRAKLLNCKVAIYGHNHIKNDELINGIRIVNPGSTSFPRDGMVGSYAIIEIENKKIKKINHILINF